MGTENITVVYKWTAKPEKLGQLQAIYEGVTDEMQANEPGATEVQIYVSEDENAIYVRDEFADAAAMGFHLSQTAAAHFPDLMAVATPGTFQFFGNVPSEMQQAVRQMGLPAEFGTHVTGYAR